MKDKQRQEVFDAIVQIRNNEFKLIGTQPETPGQPQVVDDFKKI